MDFNTDSEPRREYLRRLRIEEIQARRGRRIDPLDRPDYRSLSPDEIEALLRASINIS